MRPLSMILYTVTVTKADKPIFSHDIINDESRPFAPDVHAALDVFRKSHPAVSLADDDVKLSILKKSNA